MSTPPDPQHPGPAPDPRPAPEQQDAPIAAPTVPPMEPRPKDNLPKVVGIAVAVVLLAAVALFVWQSQTEDTVNAEVGDCISVVAASATNAETEQIDCGALAASYVVTETGDNPTCDPDETSYTQGDSTLCLRPNLNTGDCITSKTNNDDTFQKIDCGRASATDSKVALVDTAQADANKCAEGLKAVLLTERKVTYCLSPASG